MTLPLWLLHIIHQNRFDKASGTLVMNDNGQNIFKSDFSTNCGIRLSAAERNLLLVARRSAVEMNAKACIIDCV